MWNNHTKDRESLVKGKINISMNETKKNYVLILCFIIRRVMDELKRFRV